MRKNLERPDRGSTIALALGTVFILMVIVAGMQYQQNASRRSHMVSEALLEFEQSHRFEVAERAGFSLSAPSLSVSADVEEDIPVPAILQTYSSSVFEEKDGDWVGLPNIQQERGAAGRDHVNLEPSALNPAYKIFGSRTFKAVISPVNYAAYAPKGNIELEKAYSWTNPVFGEDSDHAGSRTVIAAGKNISIQNLVYGSLYTRDGEIEVGTGSAIGFAGSFPLRDYEKRVFDSAQNAFGLLKNRAQRLGDKTSLIQGNRPSIGSVIELIFNSDESAMKFMNLSTALKFPLPMIPTGGLGAPPTFIVSFHMPSPPDGGSGLDLGLAERLAQLYEIFEAKDRAFNKAKEKLQRARDKVASAGKWAKPAAEAAYKIAEKALDAAKAALDLAQSTMMASVGTLTNSFGLMGPADYPANREEERLFASRDSTFAEGSGMEGFPYGPVGKGLISSIGGFVKGVFESGGNLLEAIKGASDRLSDDVNLIHFGRETSKSEEVFRFESGGMQTTATWTVPRGRTLSFNRPMQITGDLWLQRGSVMHVGGDLTLLNPNGDAEPSGFDDLLTPRGRLFLEEGASLVVDGRLHVQGHPTLGSVLVTGEPGEVHPITSGILCRGDILLDHGILPGSTIDDITRKVEGGTGVLSTYAELFSYVAPAFSKLAGPFHSRKPYIAAHPAKFRVVVWPKPPLVVPIPEPNPLDGNLMVPIAAGLSTVFAPALNVNLGENLYPQADWWFFGDGAVPVVPRLSLEGALNALKRVSLPDLKFSFSENDAKSLVQDFAKALVTDAVTKFLAKELLPKIMEEVGKALSGDLGSIAGKALQKISKKVSERESEVDKFYKDVQNKISAGAEEKLKQIQDHFAEEVERIYREAILHECSGALVYSAEGGITIGDGISVPMLSTGFFVAERDINIEAEHVVGQLISRTGSIRAKTLRYYPHFGQASLYLPADGGWSNDLERALDTRYGLMLGEGNSTFVGPDSEMRQMIGQGWDKVTD